MTCKLKIFNCSHIRAFHESGWKNTLDAKTLDFRSSSTMLRLSNKPQDRIYIVIFLEEVQIIRNFILHFFLFKPYISKIGNGLSLHIYIYIYDLEFNWF